MSQLVQIEPLDLNEAYGRRVLAERVREQVESHHLSLADDGFRSHLGASVIGAECSRYLWLHFRWFLRETHSARMESLFDQGKRIETMLRETLESLGAEFYYPNPDDHNEQPQFSAVDGHAGGSVDGIFRWPVIGLHDWTLLECKSNKTGADFNALKDKTVLGAKYRHFAQMSMYGRAFGIKYALYLCYNKNDSEIYYEIVDLDMTLGEDLQRKADHIIHSKEAPPRISKKPTFFVCKMCSFHSVCHGSAKLVPNCRNCKHSSPVANAQWNCALHGANIPKDFISKGCPSHEFLPL